MADLVPMSQAATTSLVTTLQNTDLFALAREDNTSETGYRSKVSRVDALAKKVVNETDYSQLQTTDKKIIGAINEVNAKASKFDNMTATASGSIATFTDGGDDIPVSEYECEIVAQQASGTPTPDNSLPITGFSQADISVSGKNLLALTTDNIKTNNGGASTWIGNTKTINNVTFTINEDSNGNVISITTSGIANAQTSLNLIMRAEFINNSMRLSGCESGGTPTTYGIQALNQTDTGVSDVDYGTGVQLKNQIYGRFRITLQNGTNANGLTFKPMIAIETASSEFAPYTGNLYTVTFGQTIYGGSLIYKNGQWAIEATHGAKIYDGTETWNISDTANFYSASGRGSDTTAYYGISKLICSHCLSQNASASLTQPNCYIATSGNLNIQLPSDILPHTGEDMKSWCLSQYNNGTPLTICYELKTPVIIPITSSTRVKTISGVNNIFSNTGDNSVKYFTENADSLAELIKAFVL